MLQVKHILVIYVAAIVNLYVIVMIVLSIVSIK